MKQKRPLNHLGATIDSYILVGDYGSGKTEVAVNLTLAFARQGGADVDGADVDAADVDAAAVDAAAVDGVAGLRRPVAIADLDLVNPYFRCREAHEPLEEAGVRVVMPQGGHQFADLPILLPQVKGLLQDTRTLSVLDVGGDEVGSRVLAGLAPEFDPGRHQFMFVVNTNRPFNDTVEGCQRTIERIEGASGLRITGMVSNTHLMDETTPEMVLQGAEVARDVADAREVPLVLVAAMEEVAAGLDADALPAPLLAMRRVMVPPWLRRQMGDWAATRLGVT